MDTKPKYPRSMYWKSALIGAIVGAITITAIVAIRMYPEGEQPSPLEAFGFFIMDIVCSLITGPVIGAIIGIIAGRIGFAIKPSKRGSLLVAALGSAVIPILLFLLLEGYLYLSYGKPRQQAMQQLEMIKTQEEAIPTLPANFNDLFEISDTCNCAISNDGTRLVVARISGLTFWDLNKNNFIGDPPDNDFVGDPPGNDPIHYSCENALAFSTDGRTLAAAGYYTRAAAGYHNSIFWDVETGKKRGSVSNGSGDIENPSLSFLDLVYSPNGQMLASVDVDGTIILWDTATNKKLSNLGKFGYKPAIAFSPDSKLLATGGVEIPNEIILWDTASLKKVGQLSVNGGVRSLAFSPDNKFIASVFQNGNYFALGNIALWNMATRSQIGISQPMPAIPEHMSFSPDNQQLVFSEFGDQTVYVWDVNTLEPIGKITDTKRVLDKGKAIFLPDGRLMSCYWSIDQPTRIGIWTIGE